MLAETPKLSAAQRRRLQDLVENSHADRMKVIGWDKVNGGPIIKFPDASYTLTRDGGFFEAA